MSTHNTNRRRFLSGFLALVMLLSLLPTALITPTSAETPDSVVLDHVDYGGTAHNYTSANSALGTVWFHDFVMKDPGGTLYDGFCMDHTAKLNNAQKGHTWTYDQTYAREDGAANPSFMPRVFLDWFFYSAEAEGWDDWTKRCIQAWVQTIVWMWQAGQITSYDDEAVINLIAQERVNVFSSYDSPQTMEQAVTMTQYIIADWRNGEIPTYAYTMYNYAGSSNNIQPVLIQEPNPVQNYAGWVKVSKQNSKGEYLPGAVFTVYYDPACTRVAVAMTTTSADWATARLSFQDEDAQTFYVKYNGPQNSDQYSKKERERGMMKAH